MPDPPAESAEQPIIADSPALRGECVAFTGTLASMTHRQAFELVEQHGGSATPHVSRHTSMLVVGEEGWPLDPDGQPSQKMQQVLELQAAGAEIRVLREADWLYLIGPGERRGELQRLHTPAMLSQTLGVPVSAIRGWERLGLIRPVKTVYRLPYFDFEEVTAARRLIELLKAGIPPRQIETSLKKIEHLLPGIDRPLAQLDLLVSDRRLVYRDRSGLVEPVTGQRLFEFELDADDSEEPADADSATVPFSQARALAVESAHFRWTATNWFEHGCRLLEQNEIEPAIEALRMSLMDRPGDPETNFTLAEALYRQGNTGGALERYYAAVEADHEYIEVWTQIGCLYLERGDANAALQALDVALSIHADYPDAHLHKAEALESLGRNDEAAEHWRIYLQHDQHGPWAEKARQRLESH